MNMQLWDVGAMSFNLMGWFPIGEGSGFTIRDSSSADPHNLITYKKNNNLLSPYWLAIDTIPFFCGTGQTYRVSSGTCEVIRKVLHTPSSVTLTWEGVLPYRDWTFSAWVKYKTDTEIIVPKLFHLKKDDSSTNAYQSIKVNVLMDEYSMDRDEPTGTPMKEAYTLAIENPIVYDFYPGGTIVSGYTLCGQTAGLSIYDDPNCGVYNNFWYYLTIVYSYVMARVILDHGKAMNIPIMIVSQPDAYYYGTLTSSELHQITLKSGTFMHVSLWKKYFQRTKLNMHDNARTNQYMDPYFIYNSLVSSTLNYILI